MMNTNKIVFIGPRFKTGGTYKIGFVRLCVRKCVCASLHISKTALRIFLKLGMEIGNLELDVAVFFIQLLILLKSAFLDIFGHFFWTL